MIPLWMIATLPSMLECGCAFTSLGTPFVAQRVCPIATVASGNGSDSISATRLLRRPAFFLTRTRSMPGATSATPAESYPRYSSRSKPCKHTSSGLSEGQRTLPA